MNKGSHAPAPESKAVEGKMDHSKPAGGDVRFGYTPAGRKGKKA